MIVHCAFCRYNGRSLGSRYGPGQGPIWLDDLHCRGFETQLGQCSHRGWGYHNCGHHQDVSIACNDGSSQTTNGPGWQTSASIQDTRRPPIRSSIAAGTGTSPAIQPTISPPIATMPPNSTGIIFIVAAYFRCLFNMYVFGGFLARVGRPRYC